MSLIQKRILFLLPIFLTLCDIASVSAGEPGANDTNRGLTIPASELVGKASLYDGRAISIEGEIIGDVMKRGSNQWICVLDNGTAIGVWSDSASVYSGMLIGGYAAKGDTVRITGDFHRACVEHGGDLDVHLKSIECLAPGAKIAHPVSTGRVVAALMFCFSGGLFTFLWKRKKAGL